MESPIATKEEILELLTDAARRGNVPAMRLLLDELRVEHANSAGQSVIDELAGERWHSRSLAFGSDCLTRMVYRVVCTRQCGPGLAVWRVAVEIRSVLGWMPER
jgi:hypothetical protein